MTAPLIRKPPSQYQIMQALEVAITHLAKLQELQQAEADPAEALNSNYPPTDAEALMAVLKAEGADITRIMERLLLAADEAKAEAEMIKARRDSLQTREKRCRTKQETCRAAALGIMRTLPELFPTVGRSNALATFHSPLVDARVQQGQRGVAVNVPAEKLDERFQVVTVTPNMEALKTAVLEDGEVIDGVAEKIGDPFLVVKIA